MLLPERSSSALKSIREYFFFASSELLDILTVGTGDAISVRIVVPPFEIRISENLISYIVI
ncbi:MAG: hypothetical protein WC900_10750 [Oscillospiraceae bacterium]